MTTVAHPPQKGYRTIRLPLAESEYDRFLTDRSYAKDRLEELYEECAELFPDAFPSGEDVSEVLVCYSLGVYESQSNPQRNRVTR